MMRRTMNHLYYGDNLDVLCCYIKDESVDLVYLASSFTASSNPPAALTFIAPRG